MHRLQELVRLHRLGRRPVEVTRLIGIDRKTERRYRNALTKPGLLTGEADELPAMVKCRGAVHRKTPPPWQQRSSVADNAVLLRSHLR